MKGREGRYQHSCCIIINYTYYNGLIEVKNMFPKCLCDETRLSAHKAENKHKGFEVPKNAV